MERPPSDGSHEALIQVVDRLHVTLCRHLRARSRGASDTIRSQPPVIGPVSPVYEVNQIDIPASFVALFVPPGAIKPRETREFIAARYETCEDLATLLTDTAPARRVELGVAEQDVLVQIARGLEVEASVVSPEEARWIVRRLAELLDWPMPAAEG